MTPRSTKLCYQRFTAWCVSQRLRGPRDRDALPILGAEGNREFLFWFDPAWRSPREEGRHLRALALAGGDDAGR